MQGSDRKTPIDGAAADAPSGEPERLDGNGSTPAVTSDRPPEGVEPPAESGTPQPAPESSTPQPVADSSTPQPLSEARIAAADGPRGEETPQAATISTADTEKKRTGRWSSWAARVAARLPVAGRTARALAVAGGIAAILGAIFLPRLFADNESAPLPRVTGAPVAGGVAALGSVIDGGAPLLVDPRAADAAAESADASSSSTQDAGPPRETVWRIAQLAADPGVVMFDVPLQHRPLLAALAATRVSHGEAQRLTSSLGELHAVDHFGPRDTLTVALDKTTSNVVAYELASSPADVWQGRGEPQPDGTFRLVPKKLKLEVERVRLRKAVLVGADLHASFVDAGLAPIDDLLTMLDDALDGHAELSDIRPGARLRIVATQDQVDGGFVRWASLEAVEYFPATPNAPSVRVYRFGDEDDDGADTGAGGKKSADSKRRRGWYDGRGRQPYHGGWRSPVPLARITSRFNPHRMHPVLHVIMPHNGVDFAAPVGAPVYATAAGVVTSAGPAGPCGNRIEISHPNNIQSIYCHLSRFAAGLHVGLHVEQRQLIAYVGQTGRVTGPHLHFGIRRDGIVIDPMTLRLDGVRVVPRGSRDDFDRQRAALDAELDGVALPASTVVPTETPETGDSFYEEP